MTATKQSTTLDDIYTQEKFVEDNPDLLTESRLRWMVKIRRKNGLSETGAILKISRKIYIHKPKFLKWFLKQKA